MEIAPGATASVVMAMTCQLQATTALQMSVMKQLAEGQEQMAEILQALGVGQNIDLQT